MRNTLKEVTFFVTKRCNFNCKHCFNTKSNDDMSLQEIEKLTKRLPNFLRLQLSGGEPFIRKDLAEIVWAFYENCHIKYLSIPTNGFFTDKIYKDVSNMLLLCPGLKIHISLSLDAIWEYRDNMVGCPDTMKPLIETAKKLKELPITLGVITTQTSDNEHNLDLLREVAHEVLNVDNFGFNIARLTDKPNPEIYHNFTQKLAKTLPNFPFPLNYIYKAKRNLVFKYVYKMLTDPKQYMPCYAGKKRIVIDEMGIPYPCEYRMLGKKKIPIKDCFCQHECDMTINILFNPKFIWELIREVFR